MRAPRRTGGSTRGRRPGMRSAAASMRQGAARCRVARRLRGCLAAGRVCVVVGRARERAVEILVLAVVVCGAAARVVVVAVVVVAAGVVVVVPGGGAVVVAPVVVVGGAA